MMGQLRIDMAALRKYLLDGVNIHLKLNQSPHSFNLMAAEGTDYETRLHDVSLFIRKVTISPSVKVAHKKILYIGPAKYTTRHVEMKTYMIASGGVT